MSTHYIITDPYKAFQAGRITVMELCLYRAWLDAAIAAHRGD